MRAQKHREHQQVIHWHNWLRDLFWKWCCWHLVVVVSIVVLVISDVLWIYSEIGPSYFLKMVFLSRIIYAWQACIKLPLIEARDSSKAIMLDGTGKFLVGDNLAGAPVSEQLVFSLTDEAFVEGCSWFEELRLVGVIMLWCWLLRWSQKTIIIHLLYYS